MRFAHACAAAFWTVLLLLVTSHPVVAQNAGDRVRVVIAGDTLTGDVAETSETGFTMTLSSGIMSGYRAQRDVEYRQVEKLEVRTCCMDYARLLAAAGGLVLGAGLGELTNNKTCSDTLVLLLIVSQSCTRTGDNELWGGLIGGAVGLAVALTVLRERWETIPATDRSGPSLAPLVGIRSDYGGTTMILGTRIRF